MVPGAGRDRGGRRLDDGIPLAASGQKVEEQDPVAAVGGLAHGERLATGSGVLPPGDVAAVAIGPVPEDPCHESVFGVGEDDISRRGGGDEVVHAIEAHGLAEAARGIARATLRGAVCRADRVGGVAIQLPVVNERCGRRSERGQLEALDRPAGSGGRMSAGGCDADRGVIGGSMGNSRRGTDPRVAARGRELGIPGGGPGAGAAGRVEHDAQVDGTAFQVAKGRVQPIHRIPRGETALDLVAVGRKRGGSGTAEEHPGRSGHGWTDKPVTRRAGGRLTVGEAKSEPVGVAGDA